MCLCFAVVEVNVVDTSGDKKVDDVTFPKLDPARQSSWSGGGNSIRLTGDTIKQLGADGWFSYISQCRPVDKGGLNGRTTPPPPVLIGPLFRRLFEY